MKICLPGHTIFFHVEKGETNMTLMHTSALMKHYTMPFLVVKIAIHFNHEKSRWWLLNNTFHRAHTKILDVQSSLFTLQKAL